MRITTNYQLNSLNFYTKKDNKRLKTNPNFGVAINRILPQALALTPAVTAFCIKRSPIDENDNDGAGGNITKNKDIPTREAFQAMLDNDGIIPKTYQSNVDTIKTAWMGLYDKNPMQALKVYNLTDKNGNRIASYDPNQFTNDYPDFLSSISKNPELAKYIIDIENKKGIPQFTWKQAASIVDYSSNYENGIRTMLDVSDQDGNVRFKFPQSYEDIKVYKNGIVLFKNYPYLAKQYAEAQDEFNIYKFSLKTIINVVTTKANNKYPEDKIDNFLEIRRPDGSYVHSDLFKNCLSVYMDYPEEIKKLIQMPANSEKREALFNDKDISENALKAAEKIRKTPNSFKELANMNLFSLQEIIEILDYFENNNNNSEVEELNSEQLNMVRNIATPMKAVVSHYSSGKIVPIDVKELCKAFNIYQKYPEETTTIMNHFTLCNQYSQEVIQIPTEKDIELFRTNFNEFIRQYWEKRRQRV